MSRNPRCSPGISADDDYTQQFSCVIVGESKSGKSALLQRFTEDRFVKRYEPTIGVEFGAKVIARNNSNSTKSSRRGTNDPVAVMQNVVPKGGGRSMRVKLLIWDASGGERFRQIVRSYYRSAKVAVICFDGSERSPVASVQHFLADLAQFSDETPRVVQTKEDAEERIEAYRPDGIDEVAEFCVKNNLPFRSCSAKTGFGVDQMFEDAAELCLLADQGSSSSAAATSGKKKNKTTHHQRGFFPTFDEMFA